MSELGGIIITGASKGIGAAIALELEQLGYAICGLSRSGKVPVGQGVPCDVTDELAVRHAFAECAKTNSIVGLVNSAGLHLGAPSERLVTADYEKVMSLNATAVMVCAREVFPYLHKKGGTIVNLGSFFDRMGVPHNVAYCASKATVGAITRCLAVEWAKYGIRVLNVAPGYVATDLNTSFLSREHVRTWMAERVPVGGRPGRVDEVAKCVGSLLTTDIPYLTGETIYLDGAHGINH